MGVIQERSAFHFIWQFLTSLGGEPEATMTIGGNEPDALVLAGGESYRTPRRILYDGVALNDKIRGAHGAGQFLKQSHDLNLSYWLLTATMICDTVGMVNNLMRLKMYEVKNVQTFHGHDGGCWECSLYCDSKRVAICTEDGWGGNLQFHWLNNQSQQWDDADKKALDAFVLTLPKRERYDGEVADMDADLYVHKLVRAFLATKDVKKMLKKFAIADAGQILTWNEKPDDHKTRLFVSKNHPDAVILNDVTLEKAVELCTTGGVV